MQNITDSRRQFLKTLSHSILLVGAGSMLPWSIAAQGAKFDFRLGQDELLLHFNENALGMSPKAILAAQQAIRDWGNRYPDGQVNRLRQTLADLHGVDLRQIILGNGSTENIGAVVAHAEKVGASVVEPSPTFGDLRRRSLALGLQVNQVPVGEGFVTDLNALKHAAEQQAGPVLVNICNPNNPTGTIVDKGALADWINSASDKHLFLVDEAYYEYAKSHKRYDSVLPLIKSGKENLILTRTFSKVYGMAGMRIGYAIAAPATAAKIDRLAASFNLSAAGVAAAQASLQDTAFFEKSLASNQRAKRILTDKLTELGLPYIESHTNFVLHRINSDLASYSKRMRDNGIRVGRPMTKEDGWNRLSVGRPEDMAIFVQTLSEFRRRGWV